MTVLHQGSVSPNNVFGVIPSLYCILCQPISFLWYQKQISLVLSLFSAFSQTFFKYTVSSSNPNFAQSRRDLFLYLHRILGVLSNAPLRQFCILYHRIYHVLHCCTIKVISIFILARPLSLNPLRQVTKYTIYFSGTLDFLLFTFILALPSTHYNLAQYACSQCCIKLRTCPSHTTI